MRLLTISLVLLLVAVGCSRKALPSATAEVHDSTRVIVKEREVKVSVPGERVTVHDTIPCDQATGKTRPKEISASSDGAFVKASIKSDGSITLTGGCDSLQAVMKAKDSLIFRLRTEKITETKFEHEPYWYDMAARWISGVTIILVTGYALYKFNQTRS